MILGKKGKRGISPLVATALLILIAAAAVILIFYWTRTVSTEKIEKFGAPIEDSCNQVIIIPTLSGESVLINNQGTIPIYAINLEIVKDGSKIVRFLRPKEGIIDTNTTESITVSIQDISGNINSLKAVPVILGKSTDTGITKVYPCLNQSKSLI